jgi:hypothetical protein
VTVNDYSSLLLQMTENWMIPSKQDRRLEVVSEDLNYDDPQPSPKYTDYLSPFDLYPLLRSQSLISGFSLSPFMHTSSVTSDFHSSPALVASSWPSIDPSSIPDLKPLRLAVLSKRLDPSKRLCQYEGGGGVCRDDKCEDLHLTKLEGMIASGLLEPTGAWCVQCNALELTYFGIATLLTNLEFFAFFALFSLPDHDTAEFLFSVLPRGWLSAYQVHSPDRILEALQEVQQQPTDDLAYKVATSIALIGSFPPPTHS